MNESFLHYIWQLQYFDKKDLRTTEGEQINILQLGNHNTNAGPDFLNAKIKIGDIGWAGSVEIHTNAAAWTSHGHDDNPAYDNVILHVVWENDAPVLRADKTHMPTLELKNRVDPILIDTYRSLANNPSQRPCEKSIGKVDQLSKLSMLDKALMQRLESKATNVTNLFFQVGQDWEETSYQLLASNFGFKINKEPFSLLARSVQRKMLLKHDSLTQIEALLFGQAGLLDYSLKDEYFALLQREYRVLSTKYNLEVKKLKSIVWKFMRLRPANFPTLRIAQFSALLYKNKNLFSKIIEAEKLADVKSLFEIHTSEYWYQHYRFGRTAANEVPSFGMDSINNVLINTIVPLIVAYGKYKDDQQIIDRAVEFLQNIPAEKNRIVKSWEEYNIAARSAFDSQALIELNNNFCLKRNCLSCTIGAAILKPQLV